MNCIEARRMVTAFVKKELTDMETEAFLKHIEQCDDCMEELDIYYTMYTAFDTLDSGIHHEFDFKKMLENEIRSAHMTILRRKVVHVLRWVLMAVAEVLLLFCVYTGYEMRQGQIEQSTFQKAIYRLNTIPYRMNLLENLSRNPFAADKSLREIESELREEDVIQMPETEATESKMIRPPEMQAADSGTDKALEIQTEK